MANKNLPIKRGTCVLTEKPFAHALASKYRGVRCDYCLKRNKVLKCSKCQYAYYCNRQCQLEDWSIHKMECKYLKNISEIEIDNNMRILLRIILKLKNGGDSEKSYYTDKCYRKFEDLMSHETEIKNDNMFLIEILHHKFKELLGDKIAPNLSELVGIFGRLQINGFGISDEFSNCLGTGIYLAASIINHSCKPNAEKTFEGTTLYIRVTEDMPCLDWSKISNSYIDTLNTTKERRQILQERYYFLCDCIRCLDPNESIPMNAASCANKKCDAFIDISYDKCPKCDEVISENRKELYKEVISYTKIHLKDMKETENYDLCRMCLKKQDNILHPLNLWRVKTLEEAFISSLLLGKMSAASEYANQLIPGIKKYRGEWNSTMLLLYRIIGQTQLENQNFYGAMRNLKEADKICKITHGTEHSLYKETLLPLLNAASLRRKI